MARAVLDVERQAVLVLQIGDLCQGRFVVQPVQTFDAQEVVRLQVVSQRRLDDRRRIERQRIVAEIAFLLAESRFLEVPAPQQRGSQVVIEGNRLVADGRRTVARRCDLDRIAQQSAGAFRFRQLRRPELGQTILDKVAEATKDISTIEARSRLEGRSMVMVLSPHGGVHKGGSSAADDHDGDGSTAG